MSTAVLGQPAPSPAPRARAKIAGIGRGGVLILAALLLLTGCKSSSSSATGAGTALLPNLVGQHLSTAKDGAHSAGFQQVSSKDAGGDRMQVLDGDWKVCSQQPAPGTIATNTAVVLDVVKNSEKCPGPASPSVSPPVASTSPSPSPSPSLKPSPKPSPQPTKTHAAVRSAPTTHAPVAQPTTAPAGPPVILSPSGNYYHAGEFCPEADAGLSTVDSHGNVITCGIESGRYHWHY